MKILPVVDSGWSPCGITYPTYPGISWLVDGLCLVVEVVRSTGKYPGMPGMNVGDFPGFNVSPVYQGCD